MAERRTDPTDTADTGDPIARTRSDGEAGRGDMLGGTGTGAGAGDRLGPDQEVEGDTITFPIADDAPDDADEAAFPGVPSQHDLDAEEPRTDAGLNYHGMDNPA